MKHFMQLTEESLKELFFLRATSVNTSEKEMLASSLGASIYCPLDSDNVIERLKKLEKYGATSIILDLEDGIDFQKLEFAEENLKKVLDYIEKLEQNNKNHPYFFVRPRSPYHLADLLKRLGHSMRFLTGAALPKFEGSTSNKQDESQKFEASASGYNYLSVIKKFNANCKSKLASQAHLI
ncbi:HpcH/HpaI aldolase/citrate lyase family protein [Lactococcus cremoris]|uniref:HpcH/HpaI aldolase/citrate lyase family protein n=1 Tax=Lactococcus lactis subsp. cremoris TaxID=1359 RepID=UPI0021AA59F9|nr:HpcH/HpaI aldolase/citrate lyase family protein [Lactococcus cremoris]